MAEPDQNSTSITVLPVVPVVEKAAIVSLSEDGPQRMSSGDAATNDMTNTESLEHIEQRSYTAHEVSQHRSAGDLWIVIDGSVYNVTSFQHKHPGGYKVMAGVAGKDATKKFDKYHRRGILEKYKQDLCIGMLVADRTVVGPRKGLFSRFSSKKD